jgi:AAA family ATP:ADP antiporter
MTSEETWRPGSEPNRSGPDTGLTYRVLRYALDVRPGEVAVLLWSCLYVFCVLSAYYVIRPIRDEMGVQGGVENLQWLFTGTLLAILAFNAPFGALVKRLPRRRFIAITYRFFMLNLLAFIACFVLASPGQHLWLGRVFFIWASVFNLFVVSVFWALMVDVFDSEQGKRLFGFIAAGASIGAIIGSSVIVGFAKNIEPIYLLFASVILLEIAVLSVRRLSGLSDALQRIPGSGEKPIGGGVLTGLTHTLRSPYLLNSAAFVLLFAITSTFLYFQQAGIAATAFADRGARTQFFGQVDLLVNVLTLVIQIFLTSRILRWLGVAMTLSLLPLLSIVGFGLLALSPTIAVLVGLQVTRRVGNFAVARPTREVLFTVISREDKYKAKTFIDTVVYRAGDQVGSWSYALLIFFGLGISGVAAVAVPLSIVWAAISFWLGRKQDALAHANAAEGSTLAESRG